MPGANCSIFGCGTSRTHKGVPIFKVPSCNDEFSWKWRKKLVHIIAKDRVIDANLKNQIEKKTLYICGKHYEINMMIVNPNETTLKPGSIATLMLPVKSFTSSSSTSTKARASATSISTKKFIAPAAAQSIVSPSYKSFDEFTHRVSLLKLTNWDLNLTKTFVRFSKSDGIHTVHQYEIYLDDSLGFTIRLFLWLLPENHNIYLKYKRSMFNTTISNLISTVSSYDLCSGITDKFAVNSNSYIKHIVPKKFNVFEVNDCDNPFPLNQTEYFRSQSCEILVATAGIRCACNTLQSKKVKSLKRKSTYLHVPAKLNAPISITSPERIVLTLQGHRLENRMLQAQIVELILEIHTAAHSDSEDLNHDLISIFFLFKDFSSRK